MLIERDEILSKTWRTRAFTIKDAPREQNLFEWHELSRLWYFAASAYEQHNAHKTVVSDTGSLVEPCAFSWRNMQTALAEITVFIYHTSFSFFGRQLQRSLLGRISLERQVYYFGAPIDFREEFNKRLWT